MLRRSVFIKINIFCRTLCWCFLETPEKEDFEKGDKEERREGEKRRGRGGGRTPGVPDSLIFVGFTPEYIKELKCTHIPH